MKNTQFNGIVLFSRKHKEKDLLVKIFTEHAGKLMFYVRNVQRANNPLKSATQNFSCGSFLGNLREDGLSFLNAPNQVDHFTNISEDIELAAFATYILNLVDVALEDREADPALFGFTKQALMMIDNGYDAEIVTNIFEVQLLSRFGVQVELRHCAICGADAGAFDFSSEASGIICQRHFASDRTRYHATARAVHFVRMFSQISLDQIASISLSAETKLEIRQLLDAMYEEYVGIHLKSKRFIDQMREWGVVLKDRNAAS
jgi:DNA repair protein RecO (recombination protein O)